MSNVVNRVRQEQKSAPWLTSVPAGKPAFLDFRLGGSVHEYSIPNTRALLTWLGVRITHHVERDYAERFRIHGFGSFCSLDEICIAALLRHAESVEFRPNPEDLGVMLRYIALQDKIWGFGRYRPQSEIPSPSPEHAEAFWLKWYDDWHNGGWRKWTDKGPYHPDFLR